MSLFRATPLFFLTLPAFATYAAHFTHLAFTTAILLAYAMPYAAARS